MPRKEYYDQWKYRSGWSENKSRNYLRRLFGNPRYRYAGVRYKTDMVEALRPDWMERDWFVVRNREMKSLLKNGKKP